MSRTVSRSRVVVSYRRSAWVESLEERRLLAADYAAVSSLLNTRLAAVNAALAKAGSDTALPVINVPLKNVPGKDAFLSAFQTPLVNALKAVTSPTVAQLRTAIYNAIGPGGAKVLSDTDGNGSITAEDVQITTGTGDNVSINVDLTSGTGKKVGQSDFGFALPGLPIEVKSAPKVDQTLQMTYDDLTFGWRNNAAFFGPVAGGTPMNLHVNVGGTLTAGQIKGTQGLLPFKADITAGANGSPPTAAVLDAQYTLAVATDGSFSDQKLAGSGATFNIHTISDVGGGKYALPQITSDLGIQWGFSAAGPNSGVLKDIGNVPTVTYNNVKLDLSSLIQGTVGPLIDDVYTATRPIQPLLDVINTPLPVISALSNELGGGDVTILSLAKAIDKVVPLPANISAIIKVVDVVNTIVGVVDTIKNLEGAIDLGSFGFGDTDLRKLNYTPGEQSTLQPVVIKDPDVSIETQLDTSGLDGLVPGNLLGSGTVTIKFLFPAIEDPKLLIGTLLGRDATIAEFRAIAKFDAGTDKSFPFGPANIGFSGDAHVNVLLDLGYDTYGARKFVQNGLANPADLLQGFFVTANSIASIQGSITPTAALDLVVFSTGLEGNISLDAELKPNGGNQIEPDNDAMKIRLGDLGGKIFLTKGSIRGSLDFFVKVGVKVPFVGFVGWEKHKQIVGGTIFSWSNESIPDPFVPPPELRLGYVDPDTGWLHLATGADATVLSPSTLDDDKDTQKFTVTAAPLDPNNPDGEKAYYVTAYGYTQMFTGVSAIYAAGDNAHKLDVTVADSVKVPVGITGGALDDNISVDGGTDVALFGLGGNDIIKHSGNGNATINGGAGDDKLYGGHGQNVIFGETGKDEIYAAEYLGTVAGLNVLNGGDDDDTVTGATRGTKPGTAKIVNYIAGGYGNDNLTAGDSGDLIYGDNVDRGRYDFIYDGNDSISAGGGNDTVLGGGGDDQLNWASGDGATAFNGADGYDSVGVLGGDAGETFVIATAPITFPGGVTTQATGVSVTDKHGVIFDTVESLDLEGQGGSDTINVPDLRDSGIQRLAINVADVVSLDHTPDTVVINGTGGKDFAQLFNEGVGVKEYIEKVNLRDTVYTYGFGGVTKIVGLDNAEIRVGNVLDNVSVLTGDGADNVLVYGVSGNTTINTGAGDDYLSVAAYELKSELPKDPETPPLPKDVVGPNFNGTLVLDAGSGQNNKLGYGDFNAAGATVAVNQYTIKSTSIPNGVTFTATGGAYGGGAFIYTGDGNDTVNVVRTIAAGPTEVHTDKGQDKIVVGTPTAGGSLLGGIGNALTVDGGVDQNIIVLDNSGATGGDANALVLPNQVLGFGTSQIINYDSVGGSTHLNLVGSTYASLAEKWTLNDPDAVVEITANAGNDVLQVNALTYNVLFFGGAGADSVLVGRKISNAQTTLAGIDAAILFDGGAGTDRLFVNDNGMFLPREYGLATDELSWEAALVSMNALESVAISAGNAFDRLRVNSLLPAAFVTNFYGGAGGNDITGPDTSNLWQIIGSNSARLNNNVTGNALTSVTGNGGTDTFLVGDGVVSGITVSGQGNGDSLNYSGWTTGVTVDLNAGTASGIKAVSGVYDVQGSTKADLIRGDKNANRLVGSGGNDVIVGLDGSDSLDGGDGDDIVIGGNGKDTLGGQNGVDLLIDGTTAYDKNDAGLKTAITQWSVVPITRNRQLPAIFQGKSKLFHDAFVDSLTGGASNDDFFVLVNAVRGYPKDVITDKTINDLVLT